MKYDYLVVGAGLYGAVFAHEAKAAGKSVLVIEQKKSDIVIICVFSNKKLNCIDELDI